MTNTELLVNIENKIQHAIAERDEIATLRKLEAVDSTRWDVFLQLERDLNSHIDNLQWTINYFTDELKMPY